MNEIEKLLNQSPLYVMNVTGPDINNGPGFRITVWVSGCNHHCPGCQNHHTHAWRQGQWINDVKDKIMEFLSSDNIDGLTLSGGDPLAQDERALKELASFIKEVKNKYPNKTIWLYTGYTYEKLDKNQKYVCSLCDVVVDGPYQQENRDITIPFRGSTNQRIIDMHTTVNGIISTIPDKDFTK